MKNKIFIAFPILFILLCCSFLNKKTTNEKIKIYVASPGLEARPHYFWNLNDSFPQGIEPFLIERIFEIAEIEFEYITDFNQFEGDPRIEAVKSGHADVSIRGISITEERKEQVAFSSPYYIDGLSALVKDSSSIYSLEDLDGKKIFAVKFTTAYDWAKQNLPNSEVISYSDIILKNTSPEELVLYGLVDAYVIDYSFLKEFERKNEEFRVLNSKFTEEPYGIAVDLENEKLLKKINKALEILKKSGELEEIIAGFDK